MQDKGLDEMNEKIAREERKILKAQRMLESIRLVETLFKRLKVSIQTLEQLKYTARNWTCNKYIVTEQAARYINAGRKQSLNFQNVKFKRQNIHDVIKEKRKLMQTIKWDCDSSTTSSEHEERDESSDTMSGKDAPYNVCFIPLKYTSVLYLNAVVQYAYDLERLTKFC